MTKKPMLMLGAAMAIMSWIAEADIHAYVFQQGSFSQWLYPAANTNEIWMRLVIATLFLGFGFFFQRALDNERQKEKKINENETKYRALFESSTDAIMLLDQKEFFACNKATLNIFGCRSQDDFLKRHPAELSPPTQPNGEDSLKLADQYIATAFDKGSVKFEWMHNRLDGTEFQAGVWLTAIKLGNKCFLQATVRDISEHKKAALALVESESKFRSLAESTTVGIFLFREHFLYANPKCSEMSGYSQEQLLQKGLADLLHPDSLNEVQQNWEKRKQGDASPKHCDVQFLTKSGEVRWGQLMTALIYFEGLPTSIGSVVDITDLKQAEHDSKENEKRLNLVLDATNDGIWDWNIKTGEVFFSPHWKASLGYSEDEVFNNVTFWEKVVHPDDMPQLKIALQKHLNGENDYYEFENRLRMKNGEYRWNLDRGKVVARDTDGKPLRMVGTDIDITDRKREEELSRTLIKYSPATIYFFDDQMHFIDSNSAGERLLGYSRNELLSMSIPQVDANQEETKLAHAQLNRSEPLINYEHKLRRKDGRIITVLNNSVAMNDAQGKVTNWCSFLLDITDLKRAEHESRENEQRLSSIVVNAPIPVMVHADDGEILMLSRKWTELTGYSCADIPNIETWIAKAYGKDKRKIKQIIKNLHDKEGPNRSGEFTLRIADGSKKIWDFHSTSLGTLPDGRYFTVSMATDITERKLAEEELLELSDENSRLAQQLIQIQEQERHNLARELHDELGQKLTVIKTALGRVSLRHLNREKLAGIIQEIDVTADQVIATTRGILQRLRPGILDSIGLVGALTELVTKWEQQQGISCVLSLSDDLDDLDDDIQIALFRILQESLTNVAKHARAKHVEVHCHRHAPSEHDSQSHEIIAMIVDDDGIGIKKDAPPQGLGLIGMRERLSSLDGSIEMKTAPNKGVRLFVTIPVKKETSS